MVNGSLQCCRFDPHLLALGLFRLGGAMSEGSILGSGQRAAWVRGDRAVRYRERAEHLERMAKGETRPREQARVLELATQYRRLADDLAGQKTRKP